MATKIVCDFCEAEYIQRPRDTDNDNIAVIYKGHELSVGTYISSPPDSKYQTYDACTDCHKEIIALAVGK